MYSRSVDRIVSALAGLLTAMAVAIPPAAYLLFSYRYAVGSLEADAELTAGAVDQIITSNPEMWRFEHVRLVEYLSHRPVAGHDEAHRIVDERGRPILETDVSVPAPRITRTLPLRDAGMVAGHIEITRSLRPVIVRAALMALMLLPLGALAFWTLRTVPLRAIRRSEHALRTSEARFRALIEKSTDLVFVFDADERFQFWSPSASEALGWTADDVIRKGLRDLDLVHPEDRAVVAQATRTAIHGDRQPVRIAARYAHRDGSWRYLEGMRRNLLDDSAVGGVVFNARDTTEQRLLEEQLRQAQRLEGIGRLAGGVAHDFNNLLTVILSCAEALKCDLTDGVAPSDQCVEEIHAAGKRASELTRQLLAFARKKVIAPVPIDLNAVVHGSEQLIRRLIREDIELRVSLGDDLWSVRCDPSQIEQVILNLAVNGRDAMPRGGTLTIQTRNLHLTARHADRPEVSPGEYVALEVRDSGSGMSSEVQAHLFEPFFTTKRNGHGTGLGLATVYGFVKQSEGYIQVRSEVDQGTTFEILLPRTHEAPAVMRSASVPATTRGTETVLVVEDDARVREVTVRALRAGGYDVVVAGSAPEALHIASGELARVSLLVTDVVMPELDGRSLAEALRQRHPAMRVLYVSGYTQDAIVQRGVLDAGIEFLPKPFTAASLLARVRTVIDARVSATKPSEDVAQTA